MLRRFEVRATEAETKLQWAERRAMDHASGEDLAAEFEEAQSDFQRSLLFDKLAENILGLDLVPSMM